MNLVVVVAGNMIEEFVIAVSVTDIQRHTDRNSIYSQVECR